MDNTIKTRWLEALRSGQYKQVRRFLKCDRGNCAMGVLFEVVDPTLLFRVNKLWGANVPAFATQLGIPLDQVKKIMKMNDTQGKSFKEIADWIETNLNLEIGGIV